MLAACAVAGGLELIIGPGRRRAGGTHRG
jgi:hypothetical protein